MTDPANSIKLDILLSCQESSLLQDEFNLHIDCTISAPSPFSVVSISHSILDPLRAFSEGRIQIINSRTGAILQFEAPEQKTQVQIPQLIAVNPDRHSFRYTWTTDRSKLYSKDCYFLDLGAAGIEANQHYKVEYASHGLAMHVDSKSGKTEIRSSTVESPVSMSVNVKRFTNFNTGIDLPPAPPLQSAVRSTSSQLNLSGFPSFTAFNDWTLVGEKPIYMLFYLEWRRGMTMYMWQGGGRRFAPCLDQFFNDEDDGDSPIEEDTPEFRYGFSDPVLLRLAPGELLRLSYTYTTEERQQRFTDADTSRLKAGQSYMLTNEFQIPPCRWLYEDELRGRKPSEDQLRELLNMLPKALVESDSSIDIEVVGKHPKERGERDYAIMNYEFIPKDENESKIEVQDSVGVFGRLWRFFGWV